MNCVLRAELTFPRHVEFLMADGDRVALNCAFRAELTLSASYGISHAGWRAHPVLDCAFRAELRASRNFELRFLGFMQALRQTDAARNSS